MSPSYFLGVDAGNSKTAALVITGVGDVVGCARAGIGDIYGVPQEREAVDNVLAAVSGALGQAGIDEAAVARAGFCLAGIDWQADTDYWRERLRERLPRLSSYRLRNDGFATLRAGCLDGVGVGLTAGTGAAVVGRGPGGAEWSASMWITHQLGGGDLGRAAWRAVVRAERRLAPATALRRALLDLYGYASVAALLEAFTRRGGTPGLRHADAARTVLAVACEHDAVAAGIVAEQAEAFAAYAAAAAREVGFEAGERVPVVLGGSVFTAETMISKTTEALARTLPDAQAVVTRRPPLVGAALEALAESADSMIDAAAARLDEQPLPADLLIT